MENKITFKISPSQVSKICGGFIGKTKSHKLLELNFKVEELEKKKEEAKEGSKTMQNISDKIEQVNTELLLLNNTPDEIELPETAKSYCKKWLEDSKLYYNRSFNFSSKQTKKGNICEEKSLDFAGFYLNMDFPIINTKRFEGEFIKGTPDVISVKNKKVSDIKNRFTHETFDLFSKKPTFENWSQVQCYIFLLRENDIEINRGSVINVLMSMPDELIRNEARILLPKNYTDEDYAEFSKKYNYSDISAELRIREYEFDFCSEFLDFVKMRVNLCQIYINQLIEMDYKNITQKVDNSLFFKFIDC